MIDHRSWLRGAGALSLVLALAGAPARAADVSLTETGSSLLYPLFVTWQGQYVKTHPGVRLTSASTGSGAGIAQALSGAVQIGGSDAYMTDLEIKQHPAIVNVALAISALTVNYNLPGLNGARLKLDGPTLAGVYSGRIRAWDDPHIVALNPGLRLPHHAIVPIRRADGSGDTFVFTQYLTFSTPLWENQIGYGVTVPWPAVPGALQAVGNPGVIQAVARTPYSVSYAGVSYHDAVAKAGVGTAWLKSYSGQFLQPTPETISAAAAALTPRTPKDERLTLVNAPGANAYPLVNYEYAVVSTRQPNPAAAVALRRFLQWAIAPDEDNAKYIADAHFIPLPAHIWVLSHDQIEAIH
jgi:phosphate transport system substrate-binding protein